MKKLSFLGSSLDDLREFPAAVKSEAGYQLERVQSGLEPLDFKPMPTIGKGVWEIRIKDEAGQFRVIYIAKLKRSCMFYIASKRRAKKLLKKI